MCLGSAEVEFVAFRHCLVTVLKTGPETKRQGCWRAYHLYASSPPFLSILKVRANYGCTAKGEKLNSRTLHLFPLNWAQFG